MRILGKLVVSLVALTAAAGGAAVLDQGVHLPVPGLTRPTTSARVVEVLSGDTLDIAVDSVRTRLVLVGIEAPRVDAVDGVTDCLGPESAAALRELLPTGHRVQLRALTRREDGSLSATAHTILRQVDTEMVARGLATPSDAALASVAATGGDPDAADDGLGDAGFAQRVEARAVAADLQGVVDARDAAVQGGAGLYDPAVPCTIPGRLGELGNRLSAAALLPTGEAELAGVDLAARSRELDAVRADLAAFEPVLAGDPNQFPLRPHAGADLDALSTRVAGEYTRIEAGRAGFRDAADRLAAAAAARAEEEARAARVAQEAQREREAETAPGVGSSGSSGSSGTGDAGSAPSAAPAPAAVPPPSWTAPNDPAADVSRVQGLTYDGYEGCRAYSGFPPDAVDEQGRPFRKIDCATRRPLTPLD